MNPLRRSSLTFLGLISMTFGSLCAGSEPVVHPGTTVEIAGKTMRIKVPDTWETVGSGYVANAPLDELSAALKRKPDFSKFRVTWNSYPPGDAMSGTALYIRGTGTVEVFSSHSWVEKTVRTHVLYSGVDDAMLHKIAKIHMTRPDDRYAVHATAFFNELGKQGCKTQVLP